MSIKEQYWKYSLIVIILFMGVIIFRQITPFLGGLLGALTMYILVRTHMNYLTEKRKMKRSISALLITAETIMVFLVPLGLIIWLVVNKLQDINLAPQTFIEPIQQVAEFIKRYAIIHRIYPPSCRTDNYGRRQQPCSQSIRHDIRALLYADRRKKNGSIRQRHSSF